MPAAAALATALSAICLGDVFLTGGWFVPVVFAVLVAGAGNELARRLSAPRPLVPMIGLLVLSCYLVGRYASDQALLWVLPGPSALDRLAELAQQGNDDINRFAAPISIAPGVEMLAVGGVGLVALAVDTLAVTMRRAALAGLPLLALYTVPASVSPTGVSWEAFALGGAGFLTLLLTEARERLSRWGRPLQFATASGPTEWHGSVQTAPLAQVGRRVGAAALGLALVVPAVLPDLDASSFGFGGSGFGPGSGTGNKVSVVNPIINLGQDLRRGRNRPVIRYEGPPTYLRMVALDVFTGNTWRPSELKVPKDQNVADGLPATLGVDPAVKRERHRYTIDILGLEDQWLPLPYPTERVDIEGRWVYDTSTFNVFSVNSSLRGLSYDLTHLRIVPTPAQLRAAGPPPDRVSRYLDLPLGIPGVVKRVGEQITAGATTDYDKAMALQSWLRDPAEFTYDTHVADTVGDANGGRALAAFLDTRRGYCVHFASAMAVMARQLGIPARVAVGFTPGTREQAGRFVVGLHDLHAWPELYFAGVGWTAFEPTPGERTGNPPPWARPDAAAGGPDATPTSEPSSTESGAPAAAPKDLDSDPSSQQGNGAGQSLWQRYNLPLVPTALLLALLVLALVPFTTRMVVRRLRWRRATTPASTVVTAWAELRDTLLDHGYTWHPSDSPRGAAARVSKDMALPEEAAQAVRRLATATERARYATELGDVGDLRSDVATTRAALAAQASRWARLRARWLPRSTRAVAVALSERFADGLDAVDIAAAGVKDRVFSGRSRPDAGSSAPPAVP
jgi:transglutaminase-like putative cysteine protease